MACSSCNCSPCTCGISVDGCQPCNCADPGIISTGRHLVVLDYAMCEKRLGNAAGFLTSTLNGNGSYTLQFSNSPCVVLPTLEIAEGVQFANIVASLGDSGCFRSLIPADDADGFLGVTDGQWVLKDAATATVPDPLEVDDLTVLDQATIVNLRVSGTACFVGLSEGTVTEPIGLNADGCLVIQTSSGGGGTPPALGSAFALYYENSDETAVATPNSAIANGGYAQIGNEIADTNNIAQVQDQFTIRINSAGQYKIEWSGYYGEDATTRLVNLNLEINGGTSIPGNGPMRVANAAVANRTGPITGFTLRTLAQNDVVKLKCESSVATGNPLFKVKLLLERFAGTP